MVCLIFDGLTTIDNISLDDQQTYTAPELHKEISKHIELHLGCRCFDFYLVHNGKLLSSEIANGVVHVVPRFKGGKGGFGSMLRAIGAQIEKTTNREACRDLSGRRLRDINEEKRLKKWLAEQAEREQEALNRKKKKLEKLNEEVKHEFNDEEYTKARLEMPDKIFESVEEGFKVSTEEPAFSKETEKPKTKKLEKKKVKRKLWVDDLLDESESSEDSASEEESPKKRIKIS